MFTVQRGFYHFELISCLQLILLSLALQYHEHRAKVSVARKEQVRKEQAKKEQNTVSCESTLSNTQAAHQEGEPPSGLVKANPMAPTTSRLGRRSVQLGSPPATSAKAKVTHPNAHIAEAGIIRAIKAKNAPRVTRCSAGPTRSVCHLHRQAAGKCAQPTRDISRYGWKRERQNHPLDPPDF